jgi:hypothetical protein
VYTFLRHLEPMGREYEVQYWDIILLIGMLNEFVVVDSRKLHISANSAPLTAQHGPCSNIYPRSTGAFPTSYIFGKVLEAGTRSLFL